MKLHVFVSSAAGLCLIFLLSSTSRAKSYFGDPTYLKNGDVDVLKVIAGPPAHGSADERKDLETLLKDQAERKPQDCARAQTEVNITLDSFYGPKFGPLSADEVRKLEPFFDRIRADTDYFVLQAKDHWKRPRPYLEDPKIQPCLKREPTNAFPSGHSTISRSFADVLDEIYPDRKPKINARAREIANDRIVGGVHHPTDIEAGQKLGDAIFEALMKNAQFKHDLAQIIR